MHLWVNEIKTDSEKYDIFSPWCNNCPQQFMRCWPTFIRNLLALCEWGELKCLKQFQILAKACCKIGTIAFGSLSRPISNFVSIVNIRSALIQCHRLGKSPSAVLHFSLALVYTKPRKCSLYVPKVEKWKRPVIQRKRIYLVRNENANPISSVFGCLFGDSFAQSGGVCR